MIPRLYRKIILPELKYYYIERQNAKIRLYASEYNEQGFPVLKRYKILWKY